MAGGVEHFWRKSNGLVLLSLEFAITHLFHIFLPESSVTNSLPEQRESDIFKLAANRIFRKQEKMARKNLLLCVSEVKKAWQILLCKIVILIVALVALDNVLGTCYRKCNEKGIKSLLFKKTKQKQLSLNRKYFCISYPHPVCWLCWKWLKVTTF